MRKYEDYEIIVKVNETIKDLEINGRKKREEYEKKAKIFWFHDPGKIVERMK